MFRPLTRINPTDPKLRRFLDACRCVGDRVQARSTLCDAYFGATGTVAFALVDRVGNVFLGVSWDVLPQRTIWCPAEVLKANTLSLAHAFEPPLPQRNPQAEFTLEVAFAHLGREVRVMRPPIRGIIARGDRGSVYHVVTDGQRLMLGVWWARNYADGAQEWMWFSRAEYRLYLREEEDTLLGTGETLLS